MEKRDIIGVSGLVWIGFFGTIAVFFMVARNEMASLHFIGVSLFGLLIIYMNKAICYLERTCRIYAMYGTLALIVIFVASVWFWPNLNGYVDYLTMAPAFFFTAFATQLPAIAEKHIYRTAR